MFRYKSIGRVLKPFKNSGEMLAALDPLYFDDLVECKAIFLQVNGLEVPFFLESMELDSETSYLKVEEFSSPEEVKPFNGKDIFLRVSDIKRASLDHEIPELNSSLKGFVIVDKNSGNKYKIENIEEYPEQLMALVMVGGEESMVPLVEEWILDINPDDASILMDLPEGLF